MANYTRTGDMFGDRMIVQKGARNMHKQKTPYLVLGITAVLQHTHYHICKLVGV